MTLEHQIQVLIDNAPQDDRTPALIGAIAPALQEIAQQLQYLHYYILQNSEQRWLMTSLSNRNQPDQEKTVIYAYGDLADARLHAEAGQDPQILAVSVPIIQILFQLLAMQPVDSLLFFEQPGDRKTAVEVSRQELQDLIKTQFQRYQRDLRSRVPPDLA